MCSVKIHVLDFTEKGNDYRCEERELATLHTFVSWGKQMLIFLLLFLEKECMSLLSSCSSLKQLFMKGIYRLFSELILRGKSQMLPVNKNLHLEREYKTKQNKKLNTQTEKPSSNLYRYFFFSVFLDSLLKQIGQSRRSRFFIILFCYCKAYCNREITPSLPSLPPPAAEPPLRDNTSRGEEEGNTKRVFNRSPASHMQQR